MTAVIYARYSSDNQREESIEGQIRECTAYAEKNGITIVKHYIDRAISAKTDNRPEFQQMIVPVLKPSVQMSKPHERQGVWHEKHWQKWLGLNGGILPTLRIKVRFRACP